MTDDEKDPLDTDKPDGTEEGKPAVDDDSPEAGIEALRKQMTAADEGRKQAEKERDEARRSGEGERLAREEAERRATHASAEAQDRAASAFEAQYDSVINAHAAAKGELTAAKAGLRAAMAEGDFDKVAEFSGEIGVIAARVQQYEAGKAHLEQQRKQGGAVQQQNDADPREGFIRSKTPRTAAWLRQHDRYFTDNSFRMAVTGAHNLAVSRGISPDTDAYFAYIEEQAGLRQPEPQSPPAAPPVAATAATVTAARQSPTPAAPAAGSTASAVRPNAGGNTITLSKEEREICRINGITEAAYATQKKALMEEGRLGTGH